MNSLFCLSLQMFHLRRLTTVGTASRPANNGIRIAKQLFHKSIAVQGWEEFSEPRKANEAVITGRAWTAPDLRRKVI
jgi:hypothetical protein